jgi:hypothetical protein
MMRRYAKSHDVTSTLDPIEDVLVLLTYLTAKDYLVELLTSLHGLAKTEAVSRAKSIIAHVRTALDYLRQAQLGPSELSFLSNYYGILNLLKTYVLFGPYHADLKAQRWHGATYPVDAKDSRKLLTEVVNLKKGGALPLFYKTIVGHPWPAPTQIRMADICPYIPYISAEYSLATGRSDRLAHLKIEGQPHRHKDKMTVVARLLRRPGDSTAYSIRDFKVLRLFRPSPSDPGLFLSRGVPKKNYRYDDPQLRRLFRPFLVYSFGDSVVRTPIGSGRLLLPEELPIALLFFHMSSVVRYKPEFLERLRASRHWPILAAARQHCVLRILILAWSYFHKENLNIRHQMP